MYLVYLPMMRTEDKELEMVSVFIRGIPREVRDRFRALCVMRGTTMRQAVVEMMLKALEGSPITVPELPEGFPGLRPHKQK
jgi:hypothetical protein